MRTLDYPEVQTISGAVAVVLNDCFTVNQFQTLQQEILNESIRDGALIGSLVGVAIGMATNNPGYGALCGLGAGIVNAYHSFETHELWPWNY